MKVLYRHNYDLNSAPREIKRWGKTSDGSIGLVNDLYMSYDGNRPSHIVDAADRIVLESSFTKGSGR
ncbi:MAG: hypothetical protein K2J06_02780 [Muribaculaceae bacterium]|nr:hypothetical protein [Muribaculaceae bacterium]